jgi:hypothetical protein
VGERKSTSGRWKALARQGRRRYDEVYSVLLHVDWTGGFVVLVRSTAINWRSYTCFSVPNTHLVPQMLSLTCKLEEQFIIITSLPVAMDIVASHVDHFCDHL